MPSFNPITDIPDLTGKVILVTGANSGLGEATIHLLSQHKPSKLYLCARSRQRAQEAITRIKESSPPCDTSSIEILDLDLSSMTSVKQAASHVQNNSNRLDILFLNGGISSPTPSTSPEGYELTFATNYLGHAMLTQLLLPLLLSSSPPKSPARIIVTSSIAHKQWSSASQPISFPSLTTDGTHLLSSSARNPLLLYAQSNVARTLFALRLSQLYPSLLSVSIHPGVVKTNIFNDIAGMPWWMRTLLKPVVYFTGLSVEDGVKTQLWAAFADNKVVENGAYYEPVGVRADGNVTRDQKLAEELWDWTEGELRRCGGSGWK